MGSNIFPSSKGRNFVSRVIRITLINKTNDCIKARGDVNSRARVTHKSHELKSFMNNNESTVFAPGWDHVSAGRTLVP